MRNSYFLFNRFITLKWFYLLSLFIVTSGSVLSQPGYKAGDFHQHTTYTDGSYTIGHMMSKNNYYGLDWWANSEHGGGFTTNARVTGKDNNNTVVYWDSYNPNPIIGDVSMSGGHQKMWRWQMLRDSSFTEVLKARLIYPEKTIIQSYEMNVPGHEHGSVGLITNQFETNPNCNPLAEFEFKFDNSDKDLTGGTAQGWTKSTLSGHAKTLEALTWLKTNYPSTSYLVPAHPERKQPSSGYSIESFRDMNNVAPDICFGFESMPGHQKDTNRGGYSTSAQGGGTFGGTGYFSAIVGGLWDALLTEGRHFWLFANSDCHDEDGDFYPGEYQKNYTYTKGNSAQDIVDGLRSGNNWVVEGDLIDSLIYFIETIGTEKVTGVMGSDMLIAKGKSVKITIKARDPQGNNFNTYSAYTNPVLDHIDIIQGKITGKIDPASPNYSVNTVSTTSVIARFDANGGVSDTKNIVSKKWKSLGNGWVEMSLIVPNITDSVYFRLRGTNHGLNVTNETDADGNPLADVLMGANNGEKAFADLWFYSNPIFVYTTLTKAARFQIKAASDDLEEYIPAANGQSQTQTIGNIDWNSSDLELGCEGKGEKDPQIVGVRFADINIDKNKSIHRAYIEFELDSKSKQSDPCNLYIWSENNDNPITFDLNGTFVLTTRPKSTDSIEWNIPSDEFTVVDSKYQTSDLTSLVQANLNRSGWNAGNAMAFYIKGTGLREVESFEGEPSAAATLVIDYEMSEQDILDMQKADSIAYNLQLIKDSLLSSISYLIESEYTVPSWTLFLKEKTRIISNPDSESLSKLDEAKKLLVSANNPYSIVMNFNGNTTTNMAFNWFTNVGVQGGKVQIIEGIVADQSLFSSPLFTVDAVCDTVKNLNYCVSANGLAGSAGISNNTKKSFMSNKALVTGLTPNTTYSFRVGKEGAWSETGTFSTAKSGKETFSFNYFTDPQANTEDMFDISQKTTHAAKQLFPNVNFWLSCGDLVETSGSSNSEWEYEQFFATQQDIFLNAPFAPVAGNHDKSANKNFTHHFNTDNPQFDKEKSTTPGAVYSFVYGDALFMGLSYEDYSASGYLDSLANWMSSQVKNNPDVKWRIAFYHKTMYTGSGSHQSDSDGKTVREKMGPVFDSLKIDFALQGHDHVYEVIGPVKNKQLVSNAVSNQMSVTFDARENLTGVLGGHFDVTEGTLYFLNNSAGKKKYEPRSQAQMASVEASLGITNYFGMFTGRFGQTGRPTFSNISVSTDTISVATYEVSDLGEPTLFDSYKIVKQDVNTRVDNQVSADNNISVYPVPVRDFANINFQTPQNAFVTIYNLSGKTVRSEKVSGSTQLDLSQLNAGTYILKVTSENLNYRVKFTKE